MSSICSLSHRPPQKASASSRRTGLSLRACLAGLLLAILLPDAALAEARPRCHDPADAGTMGQTRCEGDSIVTDRAELVAGATIVRGLPGQPDNFDGVTLAGTIPDWRPLWSTAGVAAPVVTGVRGLTPDGYYRKGETIEIAVDFDMPVTVDTGGGTPFLYLNYIYTAPPLPTAEFDRMQGDSTLVFTFEVNAVDNHDALDYQGTDSLSLRDAVIASLAGVAADLTLPAPGTEGSLSANSRIFLDRFLPTVTLQMPGARLSSPDAFELTATFNEPAIDLDTSKLKVTHGAVTGISKTSDMVYAVTITPSGEGDVTVEAAAGLATDRAGNPSKAGAAVTALLDITPPVISGMPEDIEVDTLPGEDHAVVSWTPPSASDELALDRLTASHAPGSSFPAGTTTVSYVALDTTGNRTEASFKITVTDIEGPKISGMPDDIVTDTDPGKDVATVTWTEPKASDNVEVTSFTADHASGDTFPLGTTKVTYVALDDAGMRAEQSFTVTVGDAEAPVISGLPEDIEVPTDPGENTARVSWTEPKASDNVGVTSFTADHASGDTFPLGTTTVTYTATDSAGLKTTASFQVTVQRRGYVLADTQLSASPDRILADGRDQSLITVTLYDDVGYPLGYGGAEVALETTLGSLGTVSDLGDGRYTTTLTAGTFSGTARVSATVGGQAATEGTVVFEVDTDFVVAEVSARSRAFSQRRISRSFSTQPGGLGLDNRRSETAGLRFAAGLDAQGGGFAGSLAFAGQTGSRPSGRFNLDDSDSAGRTGALDLQGSWMDAEGRWHGWAELAWSRHETGDTRGSYGVLHLGLDRLMSEDLALGLMLSLDRMEETSSPHDHQDGSGWMAGPYLLAELREGLFLSSRLAFGAARDSGSYDLYETGTPWTGARDSRRALAMAALYGTTDWRGLSLTPQIELAWGGERIGAFAVSDGFGTAMVPESEVWAARLALSTRIAWQAGRGRAWITPALHWDADSESTPTTASAALELGLASRADGPWISEASLSAEGLGAADREAWTVRLSTAARF
ncbi:Invasin, domain 3 [Pseudooceanicola antarcticus]|uniref:Invasin, domain 3 n=1 Tax=Pseudooceanicola antarcticus TaxID=1247613 RepID=A0A285JC98_9RHOB|nr:HYR domain-containing protein [Pseudooceanicola antarcticus]PJE30928.1 hypothetical protein CVM39_05660 [Pseudooceanicola antarcticus]SNY57910.1 Invasin, domain 3 [Pseudooceanicola antarcticus]